MSLTQKDINAAIERGQAEKAKREETKRELDRQEQQAARDARRGLVDAIHAHLVGGALVAFIEKYEADGQSRAVITSADEEFAQLTRSRGGANELRDALARIPGIRVDGPIGSRTLTISWKRGDTE